MRDIVHRRHAAFTTRGQGMRGRNNVEDNATGFIALGEMISLGIVSEDPNIPFVADQIYAKCAVGARFVC